jgi:hypothetical protein
MYSGRVSVTNKTDEWICKTQMLVKQLADGWRVVDDDDYLQAVGEPQAEGMMSTAASFSLS